MRQDDDYLRPTQLCDFDMDKAIAERACRLTEGCADAVFRSRYVASDGLCLSHLRLALAQAAQTNPEVARLLTDTAAVKLETLSTDLSEYTRKHAWQYRHEPKLENEQSSPRRASRFFGGWDGDDERAGRTGNV